MTAYNAFPFNVINNPVWRATLTKLQQVIVDRTYGTVKFSAYGDPTITATLSSISESVESAFVLVERAAIPKITTRTRSQHQRTFGFEGEFFNLTATPDITAEKARKNAAKWFSIATFLEAEEEAKDYEEAKQKAVAEVAAKVARSKELDRIATLHFGKPISELSTNKTNAIEAIYDLEQKLADQKDAA